MTPEQMAECATQGRYWWMRADGTFYGTADRASADPGDIYLLDASPQWVAQWPDWESAAAEMAPLFERLNEFRN